MADTGTSSAVSLVMSAPPVVIDPELCLRDAASRLRDAHVGAALVVDDGRLVGILSERDVVVALADGADPDAVWAADVMTAEPVWAEPDDPLERVLRLMVVGGIRHLPVMADGAALLGVVSLRDVAGAVLDSS